MPGFLLRCLRLAVAAALAVLIAACVVHQVLQVVALALPSTLGVSSGAPQAWASFRFAGVSGRGFAVPQTMFDLVSERYRFKVGGRWYEASRIGLNATAPYAAALPNAVNVHYLPGAPRFAIAAPALSPLLWLFLLCVGLPLLYVLLRPIHATRWFVGMLRGLPPLPRRSNGVEAALRELASTPASGYPRRRWLHRRGQR